MMNQVSIVLPTYNRIDRLRRMIAALEEQDCAKDSFEVLIVSDGSTDGTDDFLKSLATPMKLLPLFQPNQGPAAARNLGVQRASAALILFLDDDVLPVPALISEHLRLHAAHGEEAVVLGPMLTPPNYRMSPWVQWEQSMLAKQYEAMRRGDYQPTARQFYTGNASLARRLLIEAGGFDPTFRRGEDVELAYRLEKCGVQFLFNPAAIVYHYAERSFHAWIKTPYDYGKNDAFMTLYKGADWLLPTIYREYHQRHPLIRALARLCLDRTGISRLVLWGLRQVAILSHSFALSALSNMVCSGMFNLRHYQGVADQLGGREQFFAGVAEAR